MQQRPRPTGRRMTRQQYEAQQRQNRIAIAIIAAIAVLIIVAVILILKPHGGGDDAVATMVEAGAGQPAAQTEAPQTQAPQSDQPQAGGVDLAAMTGTCSVDIQSIGGVKNVLFGGEGFFNTIVTGPGHVWVQSMPIAQMANSLIPFLPLNNSSN